MNKIILTIGILFSFTWANAQVGVETTAVRGDGIMDFPSPANKGIILPKNSDVSGSGTEGGSIAFDVATQTVKYYDNNPTVNAWVAMTAAATGVESDLSTSAAAVGRTTTETGNGAIVTNEALAENYEPLGVLELNSTNKALILPTVATANELPAGEAGMICYIQEDKTMAIYNGEVWTFWN